MSCAYRLPRAVADRLDAVIAGRKNAPAVRALATFLGRWWSAPRRILIAFQVDRRAIAGREDLGLTEARVRGALAVLEEVGFLARYEPSPGKRYQRTAEGLHRNPILFKFGEEYAVAFMKANARAEAARGAAAPARRPIPRPEPARPSTANVAPPRPSVPRPAAVQNPQVAQKESPGGSRMLLGEKIPALPNENLENALRRLGAGVEAAQRTSAAS